MSATTNISHAELQEAYQRTKLAGMGITFERALSIVGIRGSLSGMVRADRMWAQNANLQGNRFLDLTQGADK
jgi:hypothetical protein